MATTASTSTAAILIITLLFCSTFSNACDTCARPPPQNPHTPRSPPPIHTRSPPPVHTRSPPAVPTPTRSPPPVHTRSPPAVPTPIRSPPPVYTRSPPAVPTTRSPPAVPTPRSPPAVPTPTRSPPAVPTPRSPPAVPTPATPTPSVPTPATPTPTVPNPTTPSPSVPTPATPTPTTPTPSTPTSPSNPTCPRDILRLGACTNLLGGVVGGVIGTPVSSECCTLLSGLADLEAAVCLCTAINANVLGINLNVPITLGLIVSGCQRNLPSNFTCQSPPATPTPIVPTPATPTPIVPTPTTPTPVVPTPTTPTPTVPTPTTPTPSVPTPATPTPAVPTPTTPTPTVPTPSTPTSPSNPMCPRDILRLGACTNLLGGVVGGVIGTPVSSECCTLLSGLADLEAAVCLCTAINANVLGINLNVPVTLGLIVSGCQRNLPSNFTCQSPPSTPTPTVPTPATPTPTVPAPTTPTPATPTPTVPTPATPTPTVPTPTTPTPTVPTPSTPTSPSNPTCPRDILRLGACTNLLGGLVGGVIGSPVSSECCTLLSGLADLEAAVCLCTAIRANVLGINLNVPITLGLIVSGCQRNLPSNFTCQ